MFNGMNNPTVKGWLLANWPANQPKGVVFADQWAICDVTDQLLDQILANMVDANDGAEFARAIASHRGIELNLRHLASQMNYYKYGDAHLSAKIKLSAPPDGDPTPNWLLDDGRNHSQAIFKHNLRNRTTPGKGAGKDDAKKTKVEAASSSSDQAGGKGGRGRGRGRGKAKT